MKTKLASCVCIAACIAYGFAQSPVVTDEMQQFLNVPVWYLTYSISVRMTGPGETAGYTINGRMKMGLRSQGASLSQMSGEVRPPAIDPNLIAQIMSGKQPADLAQLAALATQATSQLNTLVGGYATWMFGANYDKSKTDAENEAEQIRVRLEDKKQALERFWWRYDGPSAFEGGRDHNEAHGTGPMLHSSEPTIEIDGTRKRFKLLFEPRFADTPQSVDAVDVVMESNIGTKDYHRQNFKRSLSTLPKGTIESYDPDLPRIFEGDLPATLGAFSGTSVHAVKGQGLSGTCTFSYSISPEPPADVELLIDPPPNLDKWMPIADEDEQTAGDVLPFKVVLQKRGGGTPQFKASKFIYTLIKTSHEKGVCMNWPPHPDPTLPYDLSFEPQRNPNLLIDEPYLAAVDSTGDMVTGSVNVSCFDYGAYGEFQASAELENGQVVYGIVRGTQDQQSVKLPARRDGSNIANAFFTANGLGNLPDDDDSETDPVGDGFKGDGLTLYEEYRGFKNGNEWTPGDPKKKNVFVLNELRYSYSVIKGIKIFERATSLRVLDLLRENQVNADNAINFNYTSGPHVVDQHVIRIKPGLKVAAGSTYASADDVGTPGTAKTLQVPPDLAAFRGMNFFALTVAHEMLHCTNVYHHGQKDYTVYWYYNGQDFFEDRAIPNAAGNGFVRANNPIPITVKREDGTQVLPASFFKPGFTEGLLDFGVEHGEHSGAEDCLMRYSIAVAYPSSTIPNLRYLTGGEPSGVVLCTSSRGTGVNASPRNPQSRYGTAAATAAEGGPDIKDKRGDCLHQVRVNDLGTEPKR
jgi:hypothetical protein